MTVELTVFVTLDFAEAPPVAIVPPVPPTEALPPALVVFSSLSEPLTLPLFLTLTVAPPPSVEFAPLEAPVPTRFPTKAPFLFLTFVKPPQAQSPEMKVRFTLTVFVTTEVANASPVFTLPHAPPAALFPPALVVLLSSPLPITLPLLFKEFPASPPSALLPPVFETVPTSFVTIASFSFLTIIFQDVTGSSAAQIGATLSAPGSPIKAWRAKTFVPADGTARRFEVSLTTSVKLASST